MDKLVLLVFLGILCKVTNSDGVNNQEVLESRLAALETKFSKMAAFMEGFEHLCSNMKWGPTPNSDKISGGAAKISGGADKISGGAEKISGGADKQIDESGSLPENIVVDHVQTIKVLTIESSRVFDDQMTIGIAFVAKENCDIGWYVRYENSTFTRAKDRLSERNSTSFVTVVTLDNPESLESVMTTIRSDSENVQISFNITAIQDGGTQTMVPDNDRKIIRYAPRVAFPAETMKTEGVTFIVEVSENVITDMNDGRSILDTFITIVNTTESPPKVQELFGYFHAEDVGVTPKNGSKNELIVNVSANIAKYGGLFVLRLRQEESIGFVRSQEYGVVIKLVNPEVNDVMPAGVVALFKQPDTMYYHGSHFSVHCGGAAIPAPSVELFKYRNDGSIKKLKPDIESKDKMFGFAVVIFSPKAKRKPDGTYICKASNGDKTVQSKFKVEKYRVIRFDEKKSVLVRNTTEKMVVTCKASGNPTPRFQLRVGNSDFGKDLLKVKDARFRHKASVRGNKAKVTLTISPPYGANETIHTIYCVALQKIREYNEARMVFPIVILQ